MRPKIFALFLLALGALVGALVLISDAEGPDLGTERTGQLERAEGDGNAAPGDLANVTPGSTAADGTRTAGSLDRAGDAAPPAAGSRALDVRIAWPAGADPSSDLTVYAMGRELPGPALFRVIGSSERAAARPSRAALPFLEEARGPNQDPAVVRAAILDQAKASRAPDGTWSARLVVPDRDRPVWLLGLGGGFVTEKPVRASGPSPTLSPDQAARIELVVTGDVPLGETEVGAREQLDMGAMMRMGSTGALRYALGVDLSEDGQTTFDLVPPGVPIEILLRHKSAAPITHLVPGLAVGETRRVELALGAGATVTGRVLGPDGRTVEGAEVIAARPGKTFGLDDEVLRRTATNAAGQFALENLPSGTVVLRGDAPTFLASRRQQVKIEGTEDLDGIDLQLDAGRSIAGIARLATGEPARGAAIRAHFDFGHMAGPSALGAGRGGEGRATTDDEGRFLVEGLGAGPFTFHAESIPTGTSDGEEGDAWRARQDGVRPGATELSLELHPPLVLRGHVIDDLGERVADAPLTCSRLVSGSMGDVRLDTREADSDDNGEFAIEDLVPGLWAIAVSSESHITRSEATLEVQGPIEGFEVVAERTVTVRGRVLDPDGEGVTGATVTQSEEGPSWRAALQAAGSTTSSMTGDDGTFELRGVRPGSFGLTAQAEDMKPASSESQNAGPGELVEGIELMVTTGGTIEGVVFDDEGQPADGRMITVQTADYSIMRNTATEADGTFVFRGLPAGGYQVVAIDASANGSGDDNPMAAMLETMNMATTEVVEGETVTVYLGAPPTAPVEISGKVERGGEPYAKAMVTWMPASESMYEQLKVVTTEKDGSYTVTLDEPGDYMVHVTKLRGGTGQQETVEFSETVPDGATVHRVDLVVPGGSIAGRVVDGEGNPVAGTRVSVMARGSVRTDQVFGGSYAEVPTDASGAFLVEGLYAGRYQVAAGGAGVMGGDTATAPARVIVGDIVLGKDSRADDIEIVLPEPGTLRVTVRDDQGAPAPGASVFLRDSEGRHTETFSTHISGPDGSVDIPGVAPGAYTVAARSATQASLESAPVNVTSGDVATIEVPMGEGTTVLAVLRAKKDAEVLAASVQILDSEGRDVTRRMGIADMQHLYTEAAFSTTERRIGPLPAGRYTVLAEAPDGRKARRRVSVGGGGTQRVPLVLR